VRDAHARRRPELTTLHEVVRDHLATQYAASAAGFTSPSAGFVRRELEGYLECGLLCRGFALMACTEPECQARHLVAFSCKGRGFCPSCLGRRMAQTAAKLFHHVLPEQVPLRQWVLTVPFEQRARLAYDGELLGGVSRELGGAVMDFSRRRLELKGLRGGKSGAVTVVQRSSSDLRLNPHYHLVALDSVYDPGAERPDAVAEAPTFHALSHLTSLDVAEVLQVARIRILRFLVRRGAVVDTEPLARGDVAEAADSGLLHLLRSRAAPQARARAWRRSAGRSPDGWRQPQRPPRYPTALPLATRRTSGAQRCGASSRSSSS
jgi:hypothetical protein